MKTLKVEFNTTQYQFAHGRKPSGRGGWAFEIQGELYWVQGSMNYGEAKKTFVKQLVEKGITGYVCAEVAT